MSIARRVLQALLIAPASALLIIVLTAPCSWSGASYALGLTALSLALAASGRPRRRWAGLGAALLAGTALVRLWTGAVGRDLVLRTGASSARLVDRLVDEQDLAINAARAIHWTRFMRDPDIPWVPNAMRDAYARMHAEQGDAPSPVVATYLGLQDRESYDTLEIGDVATSEATLLFLHGFAGSFTLPCWEMSRAAMKLHIATVCPATGWLGDWWSPTGVAIARATVADLQRRGARRIFLAGLSNGGVGASLFVTQMPGTFAGLVLVSGVSPEAAPPGIPVLALQGRTDAMIPASVVRAYTARANGRYVELDAGHFALLLREAEATAALAAWLSEHMPAPAPAAAR